MYFLTDDYRYIEFWKSQIKDIEVIFIDMLDELENEIIITNFSYISKLDNIQEIFKKNKFLVLDNIPMINKAKMLYFLGAKGYGNIYMKKEYLLSAIEAIKDGNFWITPTLIENFFEKKSYKELDNLTNREKEIAKLILEGLEYKDIAKQLNISLRTVKAHTQNIFKKFNVKNRLQFAMLFK